jgi:hypothetical protein
VIGLYTQSSQDLEDLATQMLSRMWSNNSHFLLEELQNDTDMFESSFVVFL